MAAASPKQVAFAVLLSVNLVFTVTTTALYWRLRAHSLIFNTSPILTTLQSVAHLAFTTTILANDVFPQSMPGFILFWNTALFLLLWELCIVCRASRLLVLWRFNRERLAMSEQQLMDGDDTINDVNPVRQVNMMTARVICTAMGLQTLACLILQILIPQPVSIIPLAQGQDARTLYITHLLTTYIMAGLYLFVFSPFMLFQLRTVRDANGIKRDIFTTMVIGTPLAVLWFVIIFAGRVHDSTRGIIFATLLPYSIVAIGQITSVCIPLYTTWSHGRAPMRRVSLTPSMKECMLKPDIRFSRFSKLNGDSAHGSSETRPLHIFGANDREDIERRGMPPSQGYTTMVLDPTREELARVLTDPRLFRALKRFAASDFAVNRAIFHEVHARLQLLLAERSHAGAAPRIERLDPNESGTVEVFRFIHETYVRRGAVCELEGLHDDTVWAAGRAIEDSEFLDGDVFRDVVRENEDAIFKGVFPKFVRAYNMRLLPSEDYP